jgi:hypothetical protein
MLFWRRMRGLAGMAATWGVTWALIGAAILGIRLATGDAQPIEPARLWLLWESSFAFWGALAGLAFGVTVMAAGRARQLSQLSVRKFALWGAMAGALLPTVAYAWPVLSGRSGALGGWVVSAGSGALAGAVCATLALTMARGMRQRVVEPADASAALNEGEPSFVTEDLSRSRVV